MPRLKKILHLLIFQTFDRTLELPTLGCEMTEDFKDGVRGTKGLGGERLQEGKMP